MAAAPPISDMDTRRLMLKPSSYRKAERSPARALPLVLHTLRVRWRVDQILESFRSASDYQRTPHRQMCGLARGKCPRVVSSRIMRWAARLGPSEPHRGTPPSIKTLPGTPPGVSRIREQGVVRCLATPLSRQPVRPRSDRRLTFFALLSRGYDLENLQPAGGRGHRSNGIRRSRRAGPPNDTLPENLARCKGPAMNGSVAKIMTGRASPTPGSVFRHRHRTAD